MISSTWVRCSLFCLIFTALLALPASSFCEDYSGTTGYTGTYGTGTTTATAPTNIAPSYTYNTYAGDSGTSLVTTSPIDPYAAPTYEDLRVACTGFAYDYPTIDNPQSDYEYLGCAVVHPDECQTTAGETYSETLTRLFGEQLREYDNFYLDAQGHSFDERYAEIQCQDQNCDNVVGPLLARLAELRRSLEGLPWDSEERERIVAQMRLLRSQIGIEDRRYDCGYPRPYGRSNQRGGRN